MGMLFFCELYVIRDELALLGRTAHHPRSWASTSYNYTIGPGPVVVFPSSSSLNGHPGRPGKRATGGGARPATNPGQHRSQLRHLELHAWAVRDLECVRGRCSWSGCRRRRIRPTC